MSNRSIFFQLKFVSLPKYILSRDIQYFQPKQNFNRDIFSGEIYFQPKNIFNRSIFSIEIYFQPKYMSSGEIFPIEKYVEPRNISNRKKCRAEKYFQPKNISNRKMFSTEIYFQPKYSNYASQMPLRTQISLCTAVSGIRNGWTAGQNVHLRAVWLPSAKQFQVLS